MQKYILRELTSQDQLFLEDMFYQSLFVPAGDPPFPRSIIARPGLAKYCRHWGRESDLGFLAMKSGELLGATWSRFFTEEDKGYGFIDPTMPEIGIALQPPYRGQGIGTALLLNLLQELRKHGVPAASLSVDRRNRAFSLYQRLGFEIYRQDGDATVMKITLVN